MQQLVDLVRSRPLATAIVLTIGVALAVLTVLFNDSGGLLLPTLFVMLCGIVLGGIIAWLQRNERR